MAKYYFAPCLWGLYNKNYHTGPLFLIILLEGGEPSNGPIKSLNRKVKDLKRLGRGYRNFEHFRIRFLYATYDNPIINVSTG